MKPAVRSLPFVLILLEGCSSLHYNGAGQIPGTADSPGYGGSVIPDARAKATQAGSSEVCRGSPIPRGWIAVDYLFSPGSCPAVGKSDNSANAAVIVRYSTLPPNALLVVCADQHMPYDWSREPEQEGDSGSTQCPRLAGDTRTGPNIVRIRHNQH